MKVRVQDLCNLEVKESCLVEFWDIEHFEPACFRKEFSRYGNGHLKPACFLSLGLSGCALLREKLSLIKES
eukprot:1142852-Pelagomonas_calceolata.AAC.5